MPPTLRLKDKVALITGSSSGLGRAIALAYSAEGALVVCADLQPGTRQAASGEQVVGEELQVATHELIRRRGGRAKFMRVDVSLESEWVRVVRDVVEGVRKGEGEGEEGQDGWGRIDILVNNAGISWESRHAPMKLHETPEEAWDQTMAINGKSVWLGCKHIIGQMLKQEPHACGDRGWIVNLSSIFGLVGSRIAPSYAASKGAVANLTRSLALDYAGDKIHVNAINPGFVRTGIFADTVSNLASREMIDALHPFGGSGVPDDIAGAAVFLASEDARWVTGVNLPVDGGFTAQ